ncbi:MAG TPA: class I adenylate-forming enzyme family protein [Polyangia bacterium]|nr:class I adenylate-forming enzyme family protein [Polyangia bacterium]
MSPPEAFRDEIPRFSEVSELLAALRRLPPDRPALTFYRARTLAGRLDYGQLLAAVERFTRRLRDDLGVKLGDCVAVLSPNRLEVPALLLAAMRLGAAVVPLNPTTQPTDWDYILEHSAARLIFGTRDLLARLIRPPAAVCRFEDEPPASPEPAPASKAAPEPATATEAASGSLARTMAIVLYTSGTTGNPKGVALPQSSLLANAWSMAMNFGFHDETQFAVLPLYHAHALGFGLMTTLSTGGHLVFTDRFDPFAWAEVLRAESVTLTSVVPTLLGPLLQVGVRRERVPSLRAMLVSSAPLSSALARAFETKTAIPLLQGWGLSEYTNFACCLRADLPDDERKRLLYGDELTSIGGPLPGTEVRVVGPNGEIAGPEERGELQIRGHSSMLSYFKDEGATAAALSADGWLRTGDEGFFRLAGGRPIFFITGRLKETIIRDGDKLSPLAIERRILTDIPEIEGRMVVLGFPHQVHGEEIGVYLEGEDLPDDLAARLTKVTGDMPADARPKVILHGAAPIPRTHTGKIQRRKLHATFAPFSNCRGALKIARV